MKTTNLEKLSPCKEAIDYIQTKRSAAEAWQDCERGDWMLWLAKKLNVDDKKLTMAKATCAKQVEHLMRDQRSKDALRACFDYVNGKITREHLDAAADAAYVADADTAANAAAYSAYTADAAAAYAAAACAGDNDDAARFTSLKKSADICREYLTEDVLTAYKKFI